MKRYRLSDDRLVDDTDTNRAIVGSLLGAVHGVDAIPEQWTRSVLNCRPQNGGAHVRQPRPERYWPVDVLSLAEDLLAGDRRLAGRIPEALTCHVNRRSVRPVLRNWLLKTLYQFCTID